MGRSKVDYVDTAYNPVTGCTPCSIGCQHCWACGMAERFRGTKAWPNGFEVTLHPKRLDEPAHWRKPRRVAVSFCGDLFHPAVDFRFIASVFGTMHCYNRHTYLVLTKRAARLKEFIAWFQEEWLGGKAGFAHAWPKEYGHVWLGVSVEDQATADERIPLLLQTPAAVRWISYEPALGPIDWYKAVSKGVRHECSKDSCGFPGCIEQELHLIVAGCESGPQARLADVQWFRDTKDFCQRGSIAFWLKQLQFWFPTRTGMHLRLVHAPELDGQQWQQLPEAQP